MNEMRYDLQSIQARRAALGRQLDRNKATIARLYGDLVAPPKANTKAEGWMNNFQRGLAIYDGIMTGYKLFSRFHIFINLMGILKRKKR